MRLGLYLNTKAVCSVSKQI